MGTARRTSLQAVQEELVESVALVESVESGQWAESVQSVASEV
jgi:hypothetical protein